MKFRTEIDIAPFEPHTGYQNKLLALGSCFAAHISARLEQAKFHIVSNPTGILFNPLSIADALQRFESGATIGEQEMHCSREGLWFHYGFHGAFSSADPAEALDRMNSAVYLGAKALHEADRALITFGTAWVYEYAGKTVANCHKQPASEFTRRRLSAEEIVRTFDHLFTGALADKEIVLSVSPVRHLGDGLEGNSLSKAILRVAAAELAEKHPSVHYFPAFEILHDDLRDYRFYTDDMVHPAPLAIEYVWERFKEAALTQEARKLLPQIERIVAAAGHRILHPGSAACKSFCRKQLEAIDALPQVDFHAERAYFEKYLQINS